jgi:arrestin-related trafficking adapter 3/6
MRINLLDTNGPMGTKCRNFEIPTNWPFTLLNFQATSASISIPAFSDEMFQSATYQSTCGCPDAMTILNETWPQSFLGTMADVSLASGKLSSSWRATHFAYGQQGLRSSAKAAGVHCPSRTPHLLRVPIFNPPAFDNNITPPPAPEPVDETPKIGARTPPPHYDDVVSTPSVDGFADYLSCLADYGFNGPDED